MKSSSQDTERAGKDQTKISELSAPATVGGSSSTEPAERATKLAEEYDTRNDDNINRVTQEFVAQASEAGQLQGLENERSHAILETPVVPQHQEQLSTGSNRPEQTNQSGQHHDHKEQHHQHQHHQHQQQQVSQQQKLSLQHHQQHFQQQPFPQQLSRNDVSSFINIPSYLYPNANSLSYANNSSNNSSNTGSSNTNNYYMTSRSNSIDPHNFSNGNSISIASAATNAAEQEAQSFQFRPGRPKKNDEIKKFNSKTIVNTSHTRPFACTFAGCTWSFARMSDLRRHTKSHSEPLFHCPYWRNDPTCHRNGGAFNRLDVLKRHLRLVHYVKDKKQFAQDSSKDDPGWCRSCQLMFPNSRIFVEHCLECSQQLVPTEWKNSSGISSTTSYSRQKNSAVFQPNPFIPLPLPQQQQNQQQQQQDYSDNSQANNLYELSRLSTEEKVVAEAYFLNADSSHGNIDEETGKRIIGYPSIQDKKRVKADGI